jgi:hypothetical protein
MGMNSDGWTLADGRGQIDGTRRTNVDGRRMEVDERLTELRRMSDGIAMDVGQNRNGRQTEQNRWQLRWRRMGIMLMMVLQNDLRPRALQRWRVEEIFFFFLLLHVFFILFFFFFYQSYYKGYSLHDYKFKNTQECTAQMLTSKPMYKESKCMWGCITWCRSCTTIKPCVCVCSQDLKLAIKQVLELLVPSSLRSSET